MSAETGPRRPSPTTSSRAGFLPRGAMDVASLFGARHPAHAEDLRVATASARTAHACLACLFVSTMVGFTLLRAAGLKRVLVPRSGIIGVGVAWTIACLLYTSPSPRDATLSRMPSSA